MHRAYDDLAIIKIKILISYSFITLTYREFKNDNYLFLFCELLCHPRN
ncbi:hypothetical protein SACC_21100 [Saccharolobus caldissimus]|uniref:Uncharacterized protein n=1 Tax=Saccharolobus caldissimus TaxID=1702097 RepID=A0AAQ4CTG2_9CREN|nr:hypothetical protein SACC_21100 [Saccharolobus caldissimus]